MDVLLLELLFECGAGGFSMLLGRAGGLSKAARVGSMPLRFLGTAEIPFRRPALPQVYGLSLVFRIC